MGKLIVLEGTDGVGKSTQFARLKEALSAKGIPFTPAVFPRYSEPSSALIRMYLSGEFGTRPEDVNAYAASLFYAVDRYAAFKKDWGDAYGAGELIVCDRYTTSNAVHQGGKVANQEEFFRWLYETEYGKMGLPAPDLVLYLEAPIEVTEKSMRKREAQTHTAADIHEKDLNYLRTCRETGLQAAEFYGWQVIHCAANGAMRSIEDIHAEIMCHVAKCLEEAIW